jgi:hypothetical protein
MFTQENISSCTASVVNVKRAVRRKLPGGHDIKTGVGKRAVYGLGGSEFKSYCVVIYLFDIIRIFARRTIGLKVFLQAQRA